MVKTCKNPWFLKIFPSTNPLNHVLHHMSLPVPCQVSRVIRVVIFGLALPCYAVVGAGGLWLFGSRVSANVLQVGETKVALALVIIFSGGYLEI